MKKAGTYIAFAIAFIIMVAIYPRQSRFGYIYTQGTPWEYETLVADMDFPILKTYDEIFKEKEEKASDVVDCYLYDDSVEDKVIKSLESKLDSDEETRPVLTVLSRNLKYFYEAGVLASPETDSSDEKIDVILVKRGKRISEEPYQNIYSLSSVIDLLEDAVRDAAPDGEDELILEKLSMNSTILPNLIYDEETTSLFHKEAVDYVSPTKGMVYAGQLIVSKGELITPDVQQLLDSYKAEYENVYGMGMETWQYLLAHALTSLFLLFCVFASIYLGDRTIFEDTRKLSLMLTLSLISYSAIAICMKIDSVYLFAFPFAALAAISASFFKRSVTMLVYFASLIPILFDQEIGITMFCCNLAAGYVILLTSEWLNRGWIQFLNTIFIFLAMSFVILFSCISIKYVDWSYARYAIVLVAINSVLVVVCYPFMYLLEKIFSQLSYSHLWLLSDTNNKLLTKLSHLAPGTFQHSLQVANLSEAAVKEIGGNYMLAKVGALYHDIGKLENPLCFVENQMPGANDRYHENLKPEESAHDIIKHVEDGIAIARKNTLPEEVTEFIRTHHGSTRVEYFYNQYCNAGGDPENTEPFTYSSGLPKTKEQAVLMMADAVEASSRTLKDYSPQSISELVDKIIDSKLASHQFDESDISMKEIGTVKESIKTYLQQIYHARISYPKRNK